MNLYFYLQSAVKKSLTSHLAKTDYFICFVKHESNLNINSHKLYLS